METKNKPIKFFKKESITNFTNLIASVVRKS